MSKKMNEKLSIEYVTNSTPARVQAFLRLGVPYMAEVDPENTKIHERFLQSVLRRQGEPDRWLAMLMLGNQVVGFTHFKIDKDDKPGLGYIMEFYIVPELRRQGLGQKYESMITCVMTEAGCKKIWLASHNTAEAFWHACGFRENGEFERNQKVMVKCVSARNSQSNKRKSFQS